MLTSRQKRKKAERYARAKEAAECGGRERPADLSKHFVAATGLPPGTEVILAARVSTAKQARNGDLDEQLRGASRTLERHGFKVVGTVRFVGGSNDPAWAKAIRDKVESSGTRIVVAESVDRFIRHPEAFTGPGTYDLRPAEGHVRGFKRAVGECVTFATLVPPGATPKEVRSFQRKRGQAEKGDRGGRPRKLTRRGRKELLHGRVVAMRAPGMSVRGIADAVTRDGIPVSHTTVARWCVEVPP